ncbi:hypothetical protein M408DRAFT_24599 [Serendipita vermifera MAFF 305830]|uniref:Dynamin-type G domain-containing protein n=1 Tax=Serendipita vermifera MAFF 305830 TaxID=933852 RepID=A0A0C2WM60_SERVB|nr:hypothetical protein M408DRAFT_24599 [Serendipita vermifera MAFF 305830]
MSHNESQLDRPDEHSFDIDARRLELKRIIDEAVAAGRVIRFASSQLVVPQVIVLGSQSSGKSSLFEGISGIALPHGTRTRTRKKKRD